MEDCWVPVVRFKSKALGSTSILYPGYLQKQAQKLGLQWPALQVLKHQEFISGISLSIPRASHVTMSADGVHGVGAVFGSGPEVTPAGGVCDGTVLLVGLAVVVSLLVVVAVWKAAVVVVGGVDLAVTELIFSSFTDVAPTGKIFREKRKMEKVTRKLEILYILQSLQAVK